MKIEKIKPIPQYIERLIRKKDKHIRVGQQGRTRFYAYFTKNGGELVKITVAVKDKYKKLYFKQVAVHGVHSKECFVRDIEYSYMGGYMVGWHDLCAKERERWFADGKWYVVDDKYFDPFAVPINIDYVLKQNEYRYSAVENLTSANTFEYLRLYEQYPEGEYIIKLGLGYYATSKLLLSKLHTDNNFKKWVVQHSKELQYRHYHVVTLLQSYKTNRPCLDIQLEKENKKSIKERYYWQIRKLFANDCEQLLLYLLKQKASVAEYNDYFIACTNLGLDMNLPKNKIPHDFKRWHKIRTDEYATKRAIEDEKKRKELYAKFSIVANKYLTLQSENKNAYIVIIAKSPAELIAEGKALNHCVGTSNYDQRFIREESLIFFVREKDSPDVPLATVEYSLQNHKVLQCYGYHDTKPHQQLLDFVNKTWLPYANKQIQQIAA